MQTKTLAAAIKRYFAREARDLPWRRSRDPYAVWVSEIMLQQTRVATVIPYFETWMRSFPTVAALAAAERDDVLAHWSGLGYYSRARNLHRGATYVCEHHDGELPASRDLLLKIPGVGPYTAGAIASIAFDLPVPLVDGNVLRVFARAFAFPDDITLSATQKRIWQLAGDAVPADAPGDYNQGLMELGAMVCTPSSPSCGRCPLRRSCVAHKRGLVDTLPVRKPRTKKLDKPVLKSAAVWAEKRGRLLLAKRPNGGLYAGLWELPQAPNKKALTRLLGGGLAPRRSHHHEQELTHRLLQVDVFRADLTKKPETDAYDAIRWCTTAELTSLGLSSATTSIIDVMRSTS